MSTVNERIALVREAVALKPADFARKIGDRAQRVQDIERGKQRPPVEFLTAIVEIFQIDGTWLLTGAGDMFSVPRDGARRVKEDPATYTRTQDLEFLNHIRDVIPLVAKKQSRKLSSLQIQAISDIAFVCRLDDDAIRLVLTLFDYCE